MMCMFMSASVIDIPVANAVDDSVQAADKPPHQSTVQAAVQPAQLDWPIHLLPWLVSPFILVAPGS
jgi:hypothetical protein